MSELIQNFFSLIDDMKENMKEGDYLKLCKEIKKLHKLEEKKKTNSYLLKVMVNRAHINHSIGGDIRIRPKIIELEYTFNSEEVILMEGEIKQKGYHEINKHFHKEDHNKFFSELAETMSIDVPSDEECHECPGYRIMPSILILEAKKK